MFINKGIQVTQTWKDKLNKISKAKEELNNKQSLMTAYEADVNKRGVQEYIDAYYSSIVSGIGYEWNNAIENYRFSEKMLDHAFKTEIGTWDTAKLNSEIAYIKNAMPGDNEKDNPLSGSKFDPKNKVETLYNEAASSGDKYKLRAIVEVFSSNIGRGEIAAAKLHYSRQAEEKLKAVRETEAIIQARQAHQEAWQAIQEKRSELINTAAILGEKHDPIFPSGFIDKLLRRVQIDNKTGKMQIYDMKDPQVTGIYMPADPLPV